MIIQVFLLGCSWVRRWSGVQDWLLWRRVCWRGGIHMAKDEYKIFSVEEIKAVLQNGRYHQTNVWRYLLVLVPLLKNGELVKEYCQRLDSSILTAIAQLVNEKQIKKAVQNIFDIEYQDTNIYMDICMAIRHLDSRSREIIYEYYACGYSTKEIAKKHKMSPDSIADMLTTAISVITMEVAGECKI